MTNKNNFLRNPRYRYAKLSNAHTHETLKNVDKLQPQPGFLYPGEAGFIPNPSVVIYTDYLKGLQYEQDVYVTNGSELIKRVQILPPQSEFFTINKIEYPNNENGDIAPGMKCKISLRFMPDEVRDYDDAIIVISDSNRFIIPVQARTELPELSLPSDVNIGACLQGDKLAIKQSIYNKGGESYFWLLHSEDKEGYFNKRIENGILEIGPFSIKPTEFSIGHNEEVVVEIKFNPLEVGTHEASFILCCDHCLIYDYKITGICQPVVLTFDAIDDIPTNISIKPENNEENEYDDEYQPDNEWDIVKVLNEDYIDFSECYIGDKETHKITIRSCTFVDLEYQWYLLDQNNNFIECDDIDLSEVEGILKANEELNTEITYHPKDMEQLYATLALYIKNIPKDSAPTNDIHPCGEKFVEAISTSSTPSRLSRSIHTSHDNDHRVELVVCRCISIPIHGEPLSLEVSIDKCFIEFYGNLYPGNSFCGNFTLTNLTNTTTTFNISNPYPEPCSDNTISDFSVLNLDIPSNTIEPEKPITVTITFTPKEIGVLDVVYSISIHNSKNQFNVRVRGIVINPQIKIDLPEIDFGLLGVNNKSTKIIPIKNLSCTDVELFISPYLISYPQCPSLNIINDIPINDPNKAILECEPNHYILKENETLDLKCTCTAGILPERLRNSIKIYRKNDEELYFPVRAEIQAPQVYIKETVIELGTIYIGVAVTKIIHLINISNLVTSFEFHCESESDEFDYKIIPEKGELSEKQEIEVKLIYTPKVQGYINGLFSCDCSGIIYPLGFETHSTVRGLIVSYNIIESNTPPIPTTLTPKSIIQPLPSIDFGNNIDLMKRNIRYLVISNNSGISTSFNMYFTVFSTDGFLLQNNKNSNISGLIRENGVQSTVCVTDPTEYTNNTIERKGSSSHISVVQSLIQSRNSSRPVSSKLNSTRPLDNKIPEGIESPSTKNVKRKVLDNIHEITNRFTSDVGREVLHERDFIKYVQKILSKGGQGIVFIAEPSAGELKPWEQVIVKLTCYADIPGDYNDILVCDVEGLERVNIDVSAKVNGAPLEIIKDCVGLNVHVSPYILTFPTQLVNSGVYQKPFRIKNIGPYNIQVTWRQRNLAAERENIYNVHLIPNMNRNEPDVYYKLDFEVNEKRFLPSQFTIVPNTQLIPSHCEREFIINCPDSQEAISFDSLAILDGEWKISKDRESPDGSVKRPILKDVVKFEIKADIIYPQLSIDKSKIDITVWSTKPLTDPSFTKCICLSNNTGNVITFGINTEGPFEIYEVSSKNMFEHPLIKTNPYFNNNNHIYSLPIKSNLECKIRYKVTKNLRATMLKTVLNNPKSIPVLSSSVNGKITITYNNGAKQDIPIEAHELRPMLIVKPVVFNYETVNTFDKKTTTIYLMNPTEVDVNWSLSHIPHVNPDFPDFTDDPSVFSFSVTEGRLIGPCYSIESGESHLPITINKPEKMPLAINVTFHPKQNIFYESRYRFTVEQAEPVDIVLYGFGTYEDQ